MFFYSDQSPLTLRSISICYLVILRNDSQLEFLKLEPLEDLLGSPPFLFRILNRFGMIFHSLPF